MSMAERPPVATTHSSRRVGVRWVGAELLRGLASPWGGWSATKGDTVSDIIAVGEHKKRVQFKLRIQMVAFIAAVVGGGAFGINGAAHLNSAALGAIGLVGLGVAIIAYVWSRIYGLVIIAKHQGPPNLR